jgi:hypothetical protein
MMLEKLDLQLIFLDLLATIVTQTTTVIMVGISVNSGSSSKGRRICVRDLDAVFWEVVSFLISLEAIRDVRLDILWGWKICHVDSPTFCPS